MLVEDVENHLLKGLTGTTFAFIRYDIRKSMDWIRSIDFPSLGCHRAIDGYLSAVIASTKSSCHLRELIDETCFALNRWQMIKLSMLELRSPRHK